ncbi:MAG: ABC transporter ATP-binding protein [Helicobacteraceae bacterium]
MAQLDLEHISFSYGTKRILNDINLSLRSKQSIAVVGPSGAGKTTLLHLAAGLKDLDRGKVFSTFKSPAMMFQEPRLLPWKTLIDNIALSLVARGERLGAARDAAIDLALRFSLAKDDFNKYPKDLSGGMKQRAALARAFLPNPDLLFLDEPFSALDIGLKRELQQYVIDRQDLAVFFITHDLQEAARLSDKIIVLKSDPGEIVKTVEIATPKQERSDEFVFSVFSGLLKDPVIRKVFELD